MAGKSRFPSVLGFQQHSLGGWSKVTEVWVGFGASGADFAALWLNFGTQKAAGHLKMTKKSLKIAVFWCFSGCSHIILERFGWDLGRSCADVAELLAPKKRHIGRPQCPVSTVSEKQYQTVGEKSNVDVAHWGKVP